MRASTFPSILWRCHRPSKGDMPSSRKEQEGNLLLRMVLRRNAIKGSLIWPMLIKLVFILDCEHTTMFGLEAVCDTVMESTVRQLALPRLLINQSES
mmetsp:Transcript_33534/g.89664  ORF Transcript_33534/g.89664 Transcript_33534/m.89664 type:complete len:97 (+) Transcript_33534:435-725(+)